MLVVYLCLNTNISLLIVVFTPNLNPTRPPHWIHTLLLYMLMWAPLLSLLFSGCDALAHVFANATLKIINVLVRFWCTPGLNVPVGMECPGDHLLQPVL